MHELVATFVGTVPLEATVQSALPLQSSVRSMTALDWALQAYELVGAVLGLFIAYLAYRGYRRNDSRPMLFIALGFVLVLGVPLLIVPAFYVLPIAGGQRALQAVVQTFEGAGLLCIIYALRT
jgi:uncharacterized membrane protein (DUF441 family)